MRITKQCTQIKQAINEQFVQAIGHYLINLKNKIMLIAAYYKLLKRLYLFHAVAN